MNFNFGVVAEYHQLFLKGTLLAIGMTLVCVTIGIVLGILLGMGRLAESKYAPWNHILKYGVQWPVRIYVSFFRGTPLFVKILLFHFAFLFCVFRFAFSFCVFILRFHFSFSFKV